MGRRLPARLPPGESSALSLSSIYTRSYTHALTLTHSPTPPPRSLQASAQTNKAQHLHFKARHTQSLGACAAAVEQREGGAYTVTVTFDVPHRAITAGQVLALYDGEVCLGGGVIR